MTSAVQAAPAASAPKLWPCTDPRPSLPTCIQDEIRLKNRLRRQWQVMRDPARKLESTAFRGRWPTAWTSGGTTSGAIRWNPWTVRISRYGRWEFPLPRPPCKYRED
jgi:hypothetical protein